MGTTAVPCMRPTCAQNCQGCSIVNCFAISQRRYRRYCRPQRKAGCSCIQINLRVAPALLSISEARCARSACIVAAGSKPRDDGLCCGLEPWASAARVSVSKRACSRPWAFELCIARRRAAGRVGAHPQGCRLQPTFQNCSQLRPPCSPRRPARGPTHLINARAGRQPAGLPELRCRRRQRHSAPRAARFVQAAGLESAAAAALTDEAATVATSAFFRAIMGLGVAACFLGASARGVQVCAPATPSPTCRSKHLRC